jgi:hypothetical protein
MELSRVIIDDEEIAAPERCGARFETEGDIEAAQRCGWLLEAMSRGWEGCEKWSLLGRVPEEYRTEAEQFFDMGRAA